MGLKGEKCPVGTTEDASLQPVKWDQAARELGDATSQANSPRQAGSTRGRGRSRSVPALCTRSLRLQRPGSTGDPAPQPLRRHHLSCHHRRLEPQPKQV